MAEVVFLGFGAPHGFIADVGAEVVYDGVGTPVFEAGESRTYSSATNFDTDGKDESFGSNAGRPVFERGESQLTPPITNFDTDGKDETLYGTGGPIFSPPESALIPAITAFNTSNQTVNEFFSLGTLNFNGVTFFGTPVIGPTFPVTNDH